MIGMQGSCRAVFGFAAAIGCGLVGCSYDAVIGTDNPGIETGTMTEVTSFGSNPGGLQMFVYTPAAMPPNAPVVVAMHGCTQSASVYTNAGWNTLADSLKFYVVYPQQTAANNSEQCFIWWDPTQDSRGQGEALSIRQMVSEVEAMYSVDAHRVFVTGLSAGAAMTSVMLATYPDVFSAGAIMSGLPDACATTQTEAYTCMDPGVDQTAATWGGDVRAAFPGYTGPYPRVSIWHGDSDWTVRPMNLTEEVRQWSDVNGIDSATPVATTIPQGTHTTYADSTGRVLVESYLITGMAHGVAIDPSHGCGTAGAYILDEGICSTSLAAHFFGLESATPTDGGVVTDSGTVTDAAIPTDAGSPVADASAGFMCQSFYDSNYNFVLEGKATRCGVGGSYVCAVGSGIQFGLWTLTQSWLQETAPGYFVPGQCP